MIVTIRQATPNDFENILQLFKRTIEVINAKDYSTEQIKAWTNGGDKREKWLEKISQQYFLVAESNNIAVGFGSITVGGYLDFMYVGKDFQRVGVASKIYSELERFAEAKHLDKIISDVSITAKAFFEVKGFETIQKQQVNIDGVQLTNYKMQKLLFY